VAEVLLEAAGDWKGTDWKGSERFSRERLERDILRKELLNMKASNRDGGDPDSALTFASRYGHVEVAQLLLNNGFDVDYELNPEGFYTSLHRACANGHVEVAQLLLRHFSDRGLGKYLNQKTPSKGNDGAPSKGNDGAMTSLMWAAKNGYTHMVNFF
jgi:ankyrin repeat protein